MHIAILCPVALQSSQPLIIHFHTILMHRVKDMMKRSFAEIDSAQNEDNRITELEDLKDTIASMSELTCSKCVPSLDGYYIKCSDINMLRQEVQVDEQL